MFSKLSLLSLLAAGATAQQVGTQTTETHPNLPIQSCSADGSCTSLPTKFTIDANWRWTHTVSGYENCYNGNAWNLTICSDPDSCAQACAVDGADYSGTYGVTTSPSDNSVTLRFVTNGQYSKNIGSRLFLMASDTKYQMFQLLNKEFAFDVDMSALPCGLNGALYLVEMDEDGGLSKYPGNKAGARYGTGYCDTQCPHDIKWINGQANSAGWTPSDNDANAGAGQWGSCCPEMDIWEANSISAALTPHNCKQKGQERCLGIDCGDGDDRYNGICDKDGCDFNSWRMGDTSFLGPAMTVDTTQKITVVTQFITDDGTDTGTLSEIRRKYVQNGVVIENSVSQIPGVSGNAINDEFCQAQKVAFSDNDQFTAMGGMSAIGGALSRGMVLVMSLWDDHAVQMLWLDAPFPTDKDPSAPGIARGSCDITSGVPADLEADAGDSKVTYGNIKYGPIGSTFMVGSGSGTGSGSPPVASVSPPMATSTMIISPAPPASGAAAPLYGQCGGKDWTGPTTCAQGSCKSFGDYYSQCQP